MLWGTHCDGVLVFSVVAGCTDAPAEGRACVLFLRHRKEDLTETGIETETETEGEKERKRERKEMVNELAIQARDR